MKESESSIYFCGDFFVGREVSNNEMSGLFRFANGAPTLVNLEGSLRLADAKARLGKVHPLELHESLAESLPSNVLLSLANNHSLDFGRSSYLHTRRRFHRNLVDFEKTGDVRLHDVPVRFLADPREECEPERISCYPFSRRVLADSTTISDAVLYVHGGIEYREYPTPFQRALAHDLIDAGARAVIFQHSHTRGVLEMHGDRSSLICYGLGNFFFSKVGDLHGEDRVDGQVLRYDVSNGAWSVATITPEYLSGKAALEFEAVESVAVDGLPENYRDFYKARYPLDRSLRPRQLDSSEFLTNLKFAAWFYLAKLLIVLGLSARVKGFIGRMAGRSS